MARQSQAQSKGKNLGATREPGDHAGHWMKGAGALLVFSFLGTIIHSNKKYAHTF